MKTVSQVLLILTAAIAPAFAAAPAWDSSGNGQLNGTYYFRQVVYVTDAAGDASRAITLYGNIAFSGTAAGTYTLSGLSQVDSGSQGYGISSTGTYSVSASGLGFLSDPSISGTNLYFMLSQGILIGSSTESGYNDIFIAAPVASLSNSSLSGTYAISGFFQPNPATGITALGLSYQIAPNGAGSLGQVSISGTFGTGATVNQVSSGVTYKFSSNAAVINFPTNNNAPFYSGVNSLFMYVSPDSNFVFGGSPNGFDMFVGVKTSSGASTPFSGLYYEAGLDQNGTAALDSFYGSFNAFQNNIIDHERILYSYNGASAEGDTYYSSYPQNLTGTYQDPTGFINYTIGANGFRIASGVKGYLAMEVAIPYTPAAVSASIYLDPTGIVNTASSAPYTAGISPGDFLTIYNGTGLASSTVFAPPGAFPTVLQTSTGPVKVLVDGIAAPLYYVSPTQISFLVPYAANTYGVASIQVSNNGVLSNTVTTYVHQTTPGVFTSNPVGGFGIPAILDYPANGGPFYIVSTARPAGFGDTLALYLTGLGTPFPPNGDGALGGTTCVSGSCLVNDVSIDIGGASVGTPAFAGLAPGLAGLYQVNFQVPPLCATSTSTGCIPAAGNYTLGVAGVVAVSSGGTVEDSYSNESLLPVGPSGSSAVSSDARPAAMAVPAGRRARTH